MVELTVGQREEHFLRLLALPYAGCPGYDVAWRPHVHEPVVAPNRRR